MKKEDKKDMEKMAPHHEAKRNVLKSLSDEMRRHMGQGIKSHLDEPMKKVSVEAPDAESLKKGLEVASALTPKVDDIAKSAAGIMSHEEEEPRDMDEAAMDHEEEEHEMPEDRADLIAVHRNQDDSNESEMEKLKKHLSKKA